MDFRELIPPLSRRERMVFAVLSLVAAVMRWPAVSKSLWDWDEALFVLAVREYDVAAFHPHPPGFPLFIALAKLLPLDEFRALQTLVVVASLFVFPAAFFLARELRASFFTACAAGLLLAFMPNVWFYGGTAFSDVPSMVLSMVASALLLRGCRGDRALLAGCVVLGIAAGIRPQNVLIAAAPLLIAFLCKRRTTILGAAIVTLIVIASYGGAALATGDVAAYRTAIAEHGQYIRATDSFLSEIRPSLIQVADDFFLRPFRAPLINVILAVLMLIGLVRRRPPALYALAIFGPFLLFAWLFLDFHSASRFSVAYMPLFAILAAEGLDFAQVRVPALAAVVAVIVIWMWPALRVVHTTDSPPVAALKSVQGRPIEFDASLGAHVAALHRQGDGPPAKLKEGTGPKTFARPRERLSGIARPRYFEVAVD
ncbi:MAG TPA: hypothetical protein VEU30_15010 [Thermoanaerobaculia bacterium]|nr:hypothetical protein [Thermoanaerobaculia bacterium]